MNVLARNEFNFVALFPRFRAGTRVHSRMVLNESDRKSVLEALEDVRPYIVEMLLVERLIGECTESSHSLNEFVTRLEHCEINLDDSVSRTDLRIYLGRLRRKLRD